MVDSTQENVAPILKEILKWIKFSGSKEVKNTLRDALDTDQKILVYHLSNGDNGSVKIGENAGVGKTTVSTYWKNWSRQGIVEPIKVQGGERYKKNRRN